MKRYYNTKTGNEFLLPKDETIPMEVIELPPEHPFLQAGARSPDADSEHGYTFLMEDGILIRTKVVPTAEEIRGQAILAESKWVGEQLVIAAEEIELHKDECPTRTGQEKDWRDYRNSLRAWPDSPKYLDVNYRPKVVLRDIHGNIIDG